MKILSSKPGHDGSIAVLDAGRLLFSLEAEKDSFPRHEPVGPDLIIRSLTSIDGVPDVVAVSGWVKGWYAATDKPMGAGYFGGDRSSERNGKTRLFGKEVDLFMSSHERSHLMSAYGMSPFEQGRPCYALVWEGNIGAFYEIDGKVNIRKIGDVMEEPGNKYAYLFFLADPTFPDLKGHFRADAAGKLMALTAFSDRAPVTAEEREVIDFILGRHAILTSTSKSELRHSPFYNIGVEHPAFKDLAGKFSDIIFDRFLAFARLHLTKGLPLLISGGCGLNCDWNTKWRESGLFPEVFVPPCPNDSGSAIGTAVDAQFRYTGNAKIDWDAYAGEEFVFDVPVPDTFRSEPLDSGRAAGLLKDGNVIAWVQGRYEIGPRALGNRSLLAAPFEARMHARLNEIKQRERYRPIAPICMEEEVPVHFDWNGPSPHMLYFQKLKTDALQAVTHVDRSARLQSVTREQNAPVYDLLAAFKQRTGYGVLCNTSLNFKGKGFINRMSDLVEYVTKHGVDAFVAGDRLYTR